MNILVTAGNTQTPIDEVRCITNIFTGRTGAQIALEAHRRGHTVSLFTSHPDVLAGLTANVPPTGATWTVKPYRTYADLRSLMFEELSLGKANRFDSIVHSAAVSDYEVKGVFERRPIGIDNFFTGSNPLDEYLVEVKGGKIKSSYPQLWMKLEPTQKLVDLIRSPWGFSGVLVKFKLKVGISDEELLGIAERSRQQSQADLMVANTLQGKDSWAYLGPVQGEYLRIERKELAPRLVAAMEALYKQRKGG